MGADNTVGADGHHRRVRPGGRLPHMWNDFEVVDCFNWKICVAEERVQALGHELHQRALVTLRGAETVMVAEDAHAEHDALGDLGVLVLEPEANAALVVPERCQGRVLRLEGLDQPLCSCVVLRASCVVSALPSEFLGNGPNNLGPILSIEPDVQGQLAQLARKASTS